MAGAGERLNRGDVTWFGIGFAAVPKGVSHVPGAAVLLPTYIGFSRAQCRAGPCPPKIEPCPSGDVEDERDFPMFETAFIQEQGNGQLLVECKLVRDYCLKQGIKT